MEKRGVVPRRPKIGEWREIPELLKLSRMEIATWLVTFLLNH
jgi:hypothetical protein